MRQKRDQTEVQVSDETAKALARLAHEITDQPDEIVSGAVSFKDAAVPDRLRTDEFESFHIRGRKYWLYRLALSHLAQEKTLEHLTARDIEPELWDLVCELSLRRESYRDQKMRSRRICEFLRSIERPWRNFEAILGLSDLGVTEKFIIGGVTFRKITTPMARKWGLDGHDHLVRTAKRISASPTAMTQIRAGSHAKASERAKEKVDDALNLLRFSLSGAIYANVWDEQMLFRRNGIWAVKALDEESFPETNFERGFRPMGIDIPGKLAATLAEYLRPIEDVLAGHGDDLKRRVKRAVHWIGTATTRESCDDKITDLCTALETLLATKDEGRKAEAIAIRSMLLPAALGQGFPDPGIVFFLYDRKRSDLVHGSEHRIGDTEDYRHLRQLAVRTLEQYVQLVNNSPSVTKHSKVIERIEAPERLKDVLSFLENSRGRAAEKLRAFARNQLAARTAA
jgi:DNA-binding protein Fis